MASSVLPDLPKQTARLNRDGMCAGSSLRTCSYFAAASVHLPASKSALADLYTSSADCTNARISKSVFIDARPLKNSLQKLAGNGSAVFRDLLRSSHCD